MRALLLASLLVAASVPAALAGCSGPAGTLPATDGAGPLTNGDSPPPSSPPSSTPPPPPPTSSPTSTSTSPPPPPPPALDAGTEGPGSEGGSGEEAGAYDAGGGDAGSVVPTDGGVPSTLLSLCVGEINEVRNQNGAFPYTESTQLESYAALAAASDAQSGQAHGYFYQTSGGGVATTEDELDGANVDPGGTAQQVLSQGLLAYQQNGGGGFDNLVTNQLSQVGCGFAQDGAGNWWVVIALQ
jgi:hypothetical protein